MKKRFTERKRAGGLSGRWGAWGRVPGSMKVKECPPVGTSKSTKNGCTFRKKIASIL